MIPTTRTLFTSQMPTRRLSSIILWLARKVASLLITWFRVLVRLLTDAERPLAKDASLKVVTTTDFLFVEKVFYAQELHTHSTFQEGKISKSRHLLQDKLIVCCFVEKPAGPDFPSMAT